MELYVGMDVSLKETAICVVDGGGENGLGCAKPKRGKRDSHLNPPASSNAIMQRAQPLLRREQ